jgi:hypothetical protein
MLTQTIGLVLFSGTMLNTALRPERSPVLSRDVRVQSLHGTVWFVLAGLLRHGGPLLNADRNQRGERSELARE